MKTNKIHKIDCKEGVTKLQKGSVDLIVTSPPYFAGKEYEDRYKTPEGYKKYIWGLVDFFINCQDCLKDGGHLWINIDDVHTSLKSIFKKSIVLPTHAILISELSKVYDYKEMILWKKVRGKNASGGSNRLLGSYGRFGSPGSIPIVQECEYILWFKKRGNRKDITDDMRKESALSYKEFKEWGMQIWNIKSARAKKIGHPAPYPIELVSRIIKLSTFKGDVVLDPFIGSGTTAVACKKLNRNFVGFEINQDYIDIANKRLNQELLTGGNIFPSENIIHA